MEGDKACAIVKTQLKAVNSGCDTQTNNNIGLHL